MAQGDIFSSPGPADRGPAGWILTSKPSGAFGRGAIGTRGSSTYRTNRFSSSKGHSYRITPMSLLVMAHHRAEPAG